MTLHSSPSVPTSYVFPMDSLSEELSHISKLRGLIGAIFCEKKPLMRDELRCGIWTTVLAE